MCASCVCVHVSASTLRSHDRDSGSAVIPGATMRSAGADRSGGFVSDRALLCVRVCVAVLQETPGYYLPKHHNH